VAINGSVCRTTTDFEALYQTGEANRLTVLRFSEDGTYTLTDHTDEPNTGIQFGMLDLCEE